MSEAEKLAGAIKTQLEEAEADGLLHPGVALILLALAGRLELFANAAEREVKRLERLLEYDNE